MDENTPSANDEPPNPSDPSFTNTEPSSSLPLEHQSSSSATPINPPPTTPLTPPAPPNPPLPPSAVIRKAVNEAANGTRVKELLIAKLAVKEEDKRVNALVSVLEKIEFNEKERKKIRPKPAGFLFDEAGNKRPAGQAVFSDSDAAQMEKLMKEYHKLQSAVSAALNHNDFSKVNDLASGKKEEGEGG